MYSFISDIAYLVPDVKDFRQAPLLKSRDLPSACTSRVLEQKDTHFANGSFVLTIQDTNGEERDWRNGTIDAETQA